jgi:Flp pilus assembly protein TadG
VELAFVAPVLVMALSIAIDFGRLLYFDVTVRNAVREGARIAIDSGRTEAEVKAAVQRAAPNLTIASGATTVAPASRTAADAGSTVTVTATYNYGTITPVISSIFSNP